MNTFETEKQAREYAANTSARYIVEIEHRDRGRCLVCARVDADQLRRVEVPEVTRVIRDVVDLRAEAEARLKANVLGLDELRAAYEDAERERVEYQRMMEDEYNDGARPPRPAGDPAELAAKYPVAAAYLKAEAWSMASHYAKAAAGRKATESIANGEDYKTALETMEKEWAEHCNAHMWD
ncbi:MAG: hypothetical protein JRJ78_13915 [Deltaproteobacteria bacterium]|nr:hypothetical protein [Deltaproteobacteria bacterium]